MNTIKTSIKTLIITLLISTLHANALASSDLSIIKHKLEIDTNQCLLPGTSHRIGVSFVDSNNKLHQTKGFLNGKLSWRHVSIKSEHARFFNGYIYISKNCVSGQRIPITIQFKKNKNELFYDTIDLNYETKLKLFPVTRLNRHPGAAIRFGMDISYNNNHQLLLNNNQLVRKHLHDYDVLVRGGNHKDGVFTISNNIFDYPDHLPGFLVQHKRDSNVYDVFDILLDYKATYHFNASGMSGSTGFWGSSGSSGSTAQHGQHGDDGRNAYNGDTGDDIDVYVEHYFDSILQTALLKVEIININTNKQNFYLLNTKDAKLRIDASGGAGGTGGDGGAGGAGGKGQDGEKYTVEIKEYIIKKDTAGKEIKEEVIRRIEKQRPGGSGGNGGDGGYGGAGGNGGNGGWVIVHYNEAARPFLNIIEIDISGGWAGRGGSGGSGGSGGAGGNGEPRGRNGLSGRSGWNGPDGYRGYNGKIEFKIIR